MDRAYGDLNLALVKNVGDARAILTYNSVPFIIEPGDIEPVPFEAIANVCGDPRAAEQSQVIRVQGGETRFIPDRASERRRLRQLHGMNLEGAEDEIVDNGRWPKLQVKYQSKRAYTVLEDPYGEHLGLGTDARAEQIQSDMRAQMHHMEEQLRILQSRYESGTVSDKERDFVSFEETELPADVAPDPSVLPLPQAQNVPNLDWGSVPPQGAFND